MRAMLDHPRPPSSGETVLAFDGIRGIAICMVFGFHLFQWFNPIFYSFGYVPLFRNGWIGVELFVVVSGYVIYAALRSAEGKPRWILTYAMRRFFRIYPAYFVTVIACTVIAYIDISPFSKNFSSEMASCCSIEMHLPIVLRELFLLRAIDWSIPEILNPPAWSLGFELTFYLSVPIFVALTRRWHMSAAFALLAILFYLKGSGGGREFGIVHLFYMGIFLYELVHHSLMNRLHRTAPWLIFGTGIILIAHFLTKPLVDINGVHLFPRWHQTGELSLGIMLMMLGILLLPSMTRLLSLYPLRFLGIVSYSLFLWHFPLFSLFNLQSLPPLTWIEATVFLLGFVLPGSLFVSSLSYILIERPFLMYRFNSR